MFPSRVHRHSAIYVRADRGIKTANVPIVPGIPLPPPVWMLGKIIALSFVVIWLRATFPRLREDQLQRFSWLVLIPLSLVMIMVVAVVKVATR